jgi:hypothetical protein
MANLTTGVPSPTGGWVTSKALDSMLPNEALTLDNYIPNSLNVKLRNGSANHFTGIGGQVESLMEFNNGATSKLLVAGNSSIFDGTIEGTASSALTYASATAANFYTSDKWQHVMFKGHLFACNGEDKSIDFDGTSIQDTAWTGVDTKELKQVAVFKNRLYFVQKDTASFWYAPADSLFGALTEFDLSTVAPNGGKLVSVASFTRDGGDGSDDLFVAIFETGDVILYQGDDPSDADNWSLVGRYVIAAPIGDRCVIQVGGDLTVITEDGYISLGTVIGYARSRSDMTLSANISNYIRDLAGRTRDNFGWQPVLYYRGGYLVFNAPTSKTQNKFEQHCVNMVNGSWCRLTGLNGLCWTTFQNDLYFGDEDGNVVKADVGDNDRGSNIQGHIETSFNYFESRGVLKQFSQMRPLFRVKGVVPVQIGMNTDFRETGVPYITPSVASIGTPWGSPWGSPWSAVTTNVLEWRSVSAPAGYCASFILKTECQAEFVELNSIDVLFEQGAG